MNKNGPATTAQNLIDNAPKPDATTPPPNSTSLGEGEALVKRGRGRPKGSTSKAGRPSKAAKEMIEQQKTTAHVSAKMANTVFFFMCEQVGGEKMLPDTNEAKMLDDVLTDYFVSVNFSPPPWAVLIGAYGSFVSKKWTEKEVRKETATRFMKVKAFFSNKFTKGQKDESISD